MTDITTKKDQNNRGEDRLKRQLRSIWLSVLVLNLQKKEFLGYGMQNI